MASTHKKIALSVAASQEIERLEKQKAKIKAKIKETVVFALSKENTGIPFRNS